MDGGSEREADVHACGVLPHGSVNELADSRKLLNSWEQAAHLRTSNPHNLAVQKHIFPAAEFRVEPGPQFQQGSNAPLRQHPARAWLQDAGDDLEERAFSGAIRADNRDYFAAVHMEGNIAECMKSLTVLGARGRKRMEQPIPLAGVQPICL